MKPLKGKPMSAVSRTGNTSIRTRRRRWRGQRKRPVIVSSRGLVHCNPWGLWVRWMGRKTLWLWKIAPAVGVLGKLLVCLTEEHRFGSCRAVRWSRVQPGLNLESSACQVLGARLLFSQGPFKIQSKCAHRARLETRTKESNTYASRRVENPKAE